MVGWVIDLSTVCSEICLLLTLGMHAPEGYDSCSVCVCVCLLSFVQYALE